MGMSIQSAREFSRSLLVSVCFVTCLGAQAATTTVNAGAWNVWHDFPSGKPGT